MVAATYVVEIQFKDKETNEVREVRQQVDGSTTWATVRARAQDAAQCLGRFALHSENGEDVVAAGAPPYAWVRADRQQRPKRKVRVIRDGVDEDLIWQRENQTAPTDAR